ncbi:MAG TPA: hypothetical protein VKA70_02435 [Blastocatellia bacterium]|nr:hypothetical protein [Blastocatellia bacterium]
MSSKKEALNKRVRETISALPDEALQNLVQNSPLQYTPYALQVAREELKKRKKLKSLRADDQALRQAGDEILQAGCFIEVWREKNFEGERLIIEGPSEYETLGSGENDWGDAICSLRVGPNAFVIAFESASFTGEMICFGPCQEIADLSEFAFDDEIESLKLINSVKIFEYTRQASKQESPKGE